MTPPVLYLDHTAKMGGDGGQGRDGTVFAGDGQVGRHRGSVVREDAEMNAIAGETRYRRDPEVVARRIGEETVLVPVRRSVGDLESIYTLNGPAASLWERLEAPQGVAALAAALAAEYDVDDARAAADARAFLEEMAGLRLVGTSEDV